MKYLIFFLLFACAKAQTELQPPLNHYEMVIDHHSLDTTKLYSRWVEDLGYLMPAEAIKVERAKEMWYINCATLDTLEHLYYRRNGVKIQSK